MVFSPPMHKACFLSPLFGGEKEPGYAAKRSALHKPVDFDEPSQQLLQVLQRHHVRAV
jgi:hypothetical protein